MAVGISLFHVRHLQAFQLGIPLRPVSDNEKVLMQPLSLSTFIISSISSSFRRVKGNRHCMSLLLTLYIGSCLVVLLEAGIHVIFTDINNTTAAIINKTARPCPKQIFHISIPFVKVYEIFQQILFVRHYCLLRVISISCLCLSLTRLIVSRLMLLHTPWGLFTVMLYMVFLYLYSKQ